MSRKGVFTISIDTEIAWGQCDRPLTLSDRGALNRERPIVQRLLALFAEYEIRATWAIVGHLLALNCSKRGSVVHPEIPRPVLLDDGRDWFFQHPPEQSNDPAWYGRDIVDLIRRAVPTQEIGSHSFCHMPYDEERSNPEAVRADLSAAQAVHEADGLSFDSFIFPRNVVGYRELLVRAGIKGYRGNTSRWYDRIRARPVRRLLHLASYLISSTPPTVKPSLDDIGLVNIPDSMLLMGRNGPRRLITSRALARKGIAGLDGAAKRGDVFHLWFHPSNFADGTEEQFQVLEIILRHADALRREARLEVLTMGDHIRNLTRSRSHSSASH
jgi:peptidoglycan/xylan/chitin deacetylase (PgdA/CDA1 family)